MSDPAGLICPACEQIAAIVISDQQAFCGNDECPVLMWNPAKTLAELMADMHTFRLWSQDSDGADS